MRQRYSTLVALVVGLLVVLAAVVFAGFQSGW
jgi:hypothetical protein